MTRLDSWLTKPRMARSHGERAGSDDGDDDGFNPTVAQCVNIEAWITRLGFGRDDSLLAERLRGMANSPWKQVRDNLPIELVTMHRFRGTPGCD